MEDHVDRDGQVDRLCRSLEVLRDGGNHWEVDVGRERPRRSNIAKECLAHFDQSSHGGRERKKCLGLRHHSSCCYEQDDDPSDLLRMYRIGRSRICHGSREWPGCLAFLDFPCTRCTLRLLQRRRRRCLWAVRRRWSISRAASFEGRSCISRRFRYWRCVV